MTVREEIAKNVCFYRKKKGISQKQMAALLGVNSSAISNWETNRNSIDIETLCKLCKILEISLNDVYGVYSNAVYSLSSHEKSVIQAYRDQPAMQPAVDRILGVEEDLEIDLAEDMAEALVEGDQMAQVLSAKKRIPSSK